MSSDYRTGAQGMGASRARLASLLGAMYLLIGMVSATSAQAAFGIADFDGHVSANAAGDPFTQAGGHPFKAGTTFVLNEAGPLTLDGGQFKDVKVDLPPGLVGNPEVTPRCSLAELAEHPLGGVTLEPRCIPDSQVGQITLLLPGPGGVPQQFAAKTAVYNMETPDDAPAQFGFNVLSAVFFVTPSVRSDGDYGLTLTLRNTPQIFNLIGSEFEFWGVPASSAHDADRRGLNCPSGCSASVPPLPFLTVPTRCTQVGVGLETRLRIDSWSNPGVDAEKSFISHLPPGYPEPEANWGPPQGPTNCEQAPFNPTFSTAPSADQVEAASGLDVEVRMPVDGLLNPDGIAEAHMKRAKVTLPLGTTLNPSAAEGLGVCTPADLARETVQSSAGAGCPNQSRLGSVEIETPLLEERLTGSLYLGQQDDPATSAPGAENPFDSLIAIYVVAKAPDRGIIVKLAGEVELDPRSGRIVTTFDDLPQQSFSKFSLRFREGGRAALVTPPSCGTYTTDAEFVPWSAADPDNPTPEEILHTSSQFQVTRGVGGGPCPSGGVPPFKPGFSAGSINNNAGSFTPFNMRLIRADGEQNMTKFSSILPPGVLGKLAGVSKCSDAAVALAKSKTGREELANPSCPANSQIGGILAGAGVGSVLTYVGGKVYLGGPYNGAPLSVIVITPAVAGPFDVGTVVVREALTLDPTTAEVRVDGAASDPIPHILEGIPLKLRDLRVYVDRDNFILNPTSCDPSSVKATLFGSYLDLFSAADDVPVDLASRFQAANCANLGFKPKLAINLIGGTKRGGHPALRAVVSARPGDANIGAATVTLPRSAFLDQAHIRTICTRVQFAADQCPKAAQYGFAKAITPLLDEPVQGPVYLRSSNNKLPDLVADLQGLVDVEIVGRIDSFKGGIRSSFSSLPDAPVSKFVLSMQGGKKGLVVNSSNLCAGTNRASARFTGQNGKPYNFRPVVRATRCGGKRKAKR